MKTANRCMRIPCAGCVIFGEDTGQLVSIFGKIRKRDSAIFDKRYRLGRGFHRHHDIQAGFTHFADTSLIVIFGQNNSAAGKGRGFVPAKAKISQHCFQRGKATSVFSWVFLGKLNNQNGGWLTFNIGLDSRPENGNRPRQIKHGAVNQFHRNRIKRHKMLGCIHGFVESWKMAQPHNLAGGKG